MKNSLSQAEEFSIQHLSDIADCFDAFLLDAYGVFWGSSEVGMLPKAKETMQKLVSLGKQVGILSNSTQLVAKEKEKFARHGVHEGTHYHFIITSGEVTRGLLTSGNLPFKTPRSTYCLFGTDHPRASHLTLFKETDYRKTLDLEEADFIYIPIPHIDGADQEHQDVFLKFVEEAALNKIPVLCANPDLFAHEGSPPRMVVRQGTIAQMFQKLGSPVHFIGKPYDAVYREALQKFDGSLASEKILMVGDTPETDIRGAKAAGIASALVIKTGIMGERVKNQDVSFVLRQLPEKDRPDFAIHHFEL